MDEEVGAEREKDLDVEGTVCAEMGRKESSWLSVRTRGVGVRAEAEEATARCRAEEPGVGTQAGPSRKSFKRWNDVIGFTFWKDYFGSAARRMHSIGSNLEATRTGWSCLLER